MYIIPYRKWPVTQEMRNTALDVLENAQYRTGGEQEVNFEKEFAQYVGTKYSASP